MGFEDILSGPEKCWVSNAHSQARWPPNHQYWPWTTLQLIPPLWGFVQKMLGVRRRSTRPGMVLAPSPCPLVGPHSQSSAAPFTPTPSAQQGLLVSLQRGLLVAEAASGTPLLRPSDRPGWQGAPAVSGGAGPGAESQTLFCLVLRGMGRGCCYSQGPKIHVLRSYPRLRELRGLSSLGR